MKNESEQSERELTIVRIFNAQRELTWHTWSEAEHLAGWWGPEGYTAKVEEFDFRAGGVWRLFMTGPNGSNPHMVKGCYHEITPMKRLKTELGFDVDEGEKLIKDFQIEANFDEMAEGKTRLTLKSIYESVKEADKHKSMGVSQGWESCFVSLDNYLKTLISKGTKK